MPLIKFISDKKLQLHCSESPGSESHRGDFQDKCLFVYFYQQNVLPMVDEHAFYVFVSKHRMSREFVVRSLEAGIEDHKF